MPSNLLFILLEGNDDERFFNYLLTNFFADKGYTIFCWKYSNRKREKLLNLLRSIESMNADYLFFGDIDNFPCITEKKSRIIEKFGERLDINKIYIVIKEIESWYLAGLDDAKLRKLNINETIDNTNNITKEDFERLMPNRASKIDFMQRIIELYDIDTAKTKNESFNYLSTNFN